ncbi:MAG: hypothetical protein RJQ14_06330 [Marinoscillum sp.]
MKILLTLSFVLILNSLNAQEVPTLKPTLGKIVDFNQTVQQEWAIRDKVMNDLNEGIRTWDELTPDEKATFDKYGEVYENMWDIVGGGCSWYCGGGQDTQTASSELTAQGTNAYSAQNAHDLSYETAWVEGVSGYGIGEFIEYHIKPENPRITEIIVVNGYVKSSNAWKNNSRVKKLKMYIDNKPYVILELEDSKMNSISRLNRLDMEIVKTSNY